MTKHTHFSKLPLAAGGVILLALIIFLAHKVLVFQISLPRQGNTVVYRDIVSSGTKVCLCYIHSVERTPVQGWFSLDPQGGFQAQRTLSKGTGTGMPNVVDQQGVQMEDGWMVVDEGQTHIPEIPFYYLPLNDLRISVNDHQVDLNGVPPGSRLLITNQKMSLARAMFRLLTIPGL